MEPKLTVKVNPFSENALTLFTGAYKKFYKELYGDSPEHIPVELYLPGPKERDENYFEAVERRIREVKEGWKIVPYTIHNPGRNFDGTLFNFVLYPESTIETTLELVKLGREIGSEYVVIHPIGGHKGKYTFKPENFVDQREIKDSLLNIHNLLF